MRKLSGSSGKGYYINNEFIINIVPLGSGTSRTLSAFAATFGASFWCKLRLSTRHNKDATTRATVMFRKVPIPEAALSTAATTLTSPSQSPQCVVEYSVLCSLAASWLLHRGRLAIALVVLML
jgi:hypothetical protein